MTKIFTSIIILLICGSVTAAPVLTKSQAGELAKVILTAKENKKYQTLFKVENMTYVSEKGIWRFPGIGFGGIMHVFEIRDKDGYYLLGTISTHSFAPASPKFRIAPSLRRKIRALMKKFADEKKLD